jgi:Tol biopolymer transport system component
VARRHRGGRRACRRRRWRLRVLATAGWPLIRRYLLPAVLAALTVAACSGDDDADPTPLPGLSPTGAATTDIVPPPPADVFILYRDAAGDLVANNLESGEVYRQTVDFEVEIISQAACTPDGSRIAYLKQDFSQLDRQLIVRGENAPAEPIPVPPSVQDIDWSPDGTHVALAEWNGLEQEHTVSALDVRTGFPSEITSGPGYLSALSWSPAGDRLAFYIQDIETAQAEIYTLDVGGGEPQRITGDDDVAWFDPDWAPDGQTLIAAGQSPEAAQLYRLDPASGEPQQLTQSADIYRRGPQYSPDGTTVAYTGSIILPGVASTAVALHSFGIFLVAPDGSDERSLTADPRENPGANVDPYLDAFLLGWCTEGPWLDDLWTEESA